MNMAYIETNGIRISKKPRKQRKWLIASLTTVLALIVSIIATSYSVYFAIQNQNLQNSLYSFQPFIFSNYTSSTLKTLIYIPNDNSFDLFGNVAVDLKVITPYDGMLTINVTTFNFTHIGERYYQGSQLLDMNYLNFSEHSPFDMLATPHQYFISRDVINPIEDKILVRLTVFLKPNWLPPNATAIGFDLGDLTFEANLFAVRTNQTITKTFTEDVFGMFTPTS